MADNEQTEEQFDDDDIVTLIDDDGEEIDFIEIAGIMIEEGFYTIMQPVELLDGMDDDEALVFKTEIDGEGDAKYEIELDDAVIDKVFAEYNRLLDEEE